MIDSRVLSSASVEVSEGYGYWSYQFKEVKE